MINVGAGAGSYEPPQTVLAVEPSLVMISQRPGGSAPVVQAQAEALPIASNAALRRLAAELDSGRWRDRHRDLLQRENYDAGYRLLIAEQ